jgi:K+-sensing histidine kinase KdpD
LSAGASVLVCIGAGFLLFSGSDDTRISAALLSVSLPVLSLPVFDLSASRIRFGKTTLVLTRTIQYVLFAGSVLVLYLLVHYLMTSFYPAADYLNIPEILIVVFIVLIFRGIYHRFQPYLRRLGISFQQRQVEGIVEFMARVPRYTHSHDLLQDSVAQIERYFNARKVVFWLDDKSTQTTELPHDNMLMSVYRQFNVGDTFWSANKELSPKQMTEVEEVALVAGDWALMLPMRFSGAKAGLLMLGRKQKGVYNLEDIDVLKRLNTQIWLTLDILYLLENEKLLMQKTMEANLTALRSQINPHFLFNTLNTIAALIHDNPGMAELAVENLAFIFRYTLKTSGENFVTVENEMTLVRKYLEIEEFRFGERLTVDIQIADDCKGYAMPALVIQTIVENCIKHGINKIMHNGLVSIRIFARSDDFFVTEIEDTGPGIHSDRIFKGTGLNNIHSRLHSLYDRQDLITFENTGNGTLVTLTLPKQKYEK